MTSALPPELIERIEASSVRLDARPDPSPEPAPPPAAEYSLTCGACGHADTLTVDPSKALLTCDECGAKIAYGVAMPKLTNLPHPEDRRFLQSRIEGQVGTVTITLERAYAAQYALDILSVCDPPAYARAMNRGTGAAHRVR